MVITITPDNFNDAIEKSSKPVVIDVFATWCGPCKHMAPLFEELEEELGDKYTFAKLNVDQARDIAVSYGVSAIPTFIFLKNNNVVDKFSGSLSKEDLQSKIEELLD